MSYRPITDVWLLARPKVKFYGAYPNGFLERARALLGVSSFDSVLHVCGGAAKQYPTWNKLGVLDKTLDLDPICKPDFLADARESILHSPLWAAILCDPPYTLEHAKQYSPGADKLPMPNSLLKNALKAVRIGGRVGFLHYLLPRPPASVPAKLIAIVGVICGFNNRIRIYSVFERLPHARTTIVVHNGQ